MDRLNHLFIPDQIFFNGEQLKEHWAAENYDVVGDSIVAFIGPCQVSPDFLFDIRHRKKKTPIKSELMLHFIAEHFDTDYEKAVLRQKLLIHILKDKLNHRLGGDTLQRWGDDLFDGDAKVTITAVVKTKVSTKIHVGVNISSKNTPVKTKGLQDYNLDAQEVSQVVMNQYRLDILKIAEKIVSTKAL
ncbi:MAG: hypothetical protein A2145_06510 [candidate division Zixibacteria bacterium RBG_16_40_9]|nr:MAG: hypothetical protein A2145_06510 [candidate division Zixibacteria bacterium RBG_16_40_9]